MFNSTTLQLTPVKQTEILIVFLAYIRRTVCRQPLLCIPSLSFCTLCTNYYSSVLSAVVFRTKLTETCVRSRWEINVFLGKFTCKEISLAFVMICRSSLTKWCVRFLFLFSNLINPRLLSVEQTRKDPACSVSTARRITTLWATQQQLFRVSPMYFTSRFF